MQKALTKEDLVYILSNLFKISSEDNNAFRVLDDGLFTLDFHVHSDDETIHIDERIKNILNNITLDDNGNIYYNDNRLSVVSKEDNNAIVQKEDGIFAKDFYQDYTNHVNDEEIHVNKEYVDLINSHMSDDNIHVTEDDKDNWDSTLENAQHYTDEALSNLALYDFVIVDELPLIQDINDTTCYLKLVEPLEDSDLSAIPYVWYDGKWLQLTLSDVALAYWKQTFQEKIEEEYLKKTDKSIHTHDNKSVLDSLSDDNGSLLYKGNKIIESLISDKAKNAVQYDSENKLFVRDYSEEIKSLNKGASFAKIVLYDDIITECGAYTLNDSIEDYNLLYIDYYHFPSEQDDAIPANAKSVIIDTDTLLELHDMGIDYMLEVGYGVSVSNAKIHVYNNKFVLNYNHDIAIYKIAGIRKGDDVNG